MLFGGRLIFDRLSSLREDIEALKRHFPDDDASDEDTPSLRWKE